jgi:flagella basal body P-ring formation protein FlgA
MKACNFLLFFWMFFIAHPTISDEYSTAETISDKTKAFLQEKVNQQLPPEEHNGVKISLRNINPNLQLPKCDNALTLSLQSQSIQRNTSVKVNCKGNRPWSMYVSSIISVEKDVIAVRSGLPRHHILQEEDLITIKKDKYSLRGGYNTQPSHLIGQQLKRALRSGDIIYSYHLQAPDIIKKGDLVTVIAKRGALAVMSAGVALNNASKGEKVRVENQRSSRVVHAKVIGPATVEVL